MDFLSDLLQIVTSVSDAPNSPGFGTGLPGSAGPPMAGGGPGGPGGDSPYGPPAAPPGTPDTPQPPPDEPDGPDECE